MKGAQVEIGEDEGGWYFVIGAQISPRYPSPEDARRRARERLALLSGAAGPEADRTTPKGGGTIDET